MPRRQRGVVRRRLEASPERGVVGLRLGIAPCLAVLRLRARGVGGDRVAAEAQAYFAALKSRFKVEVTLPAATEAAVLK